MSIYFISDLHLQESEPAMTQGFLNYLDSLTDAQALYILGDFFEVWIGDDYESQLINEVKSALKSLSLRGVKLYLMHGNRDFLIGDDFCKQVGATLLEDPSIIDFNGEKVLLMHGDSMCTKDLAYMKMRPMLRNPMMQERLLNQTIEERLMMAANMRGESQKGNQMKAADIMDVTPEEVDKVMTENSVKTLIHGHTHRPFDHYWQHDNEQRRRIVLGDWSNTQGWQIRYNQTTGFELSEFKF